MTIQQTTESFILKSKTINGNKFTYNNTIYERYNKKLIITCLIHGDFYVNPNQHLAMKTGCRKCGDIIGKRKRSLTKELFILKANKIYNNKYDYSLVEYISNRVPVKIICPIHSLFEQRPNNHLINRGCKKCGTEVQRIGMTIKLEDFINKCNLIYNNKYNYDLINELNRKIKVKIICPFHGIYEKFHNRHLQGGGCKTCSNLLSNYKKDDWIKRGKGKIGTFYIIKCFNKYEYFYKLGITFKTVKERYHDKSSMPYQYIIKKEIKSMDLSYIWDLENYMKRNIKNYKTKIYFPGNKYECFKKYKDSIKLLRLHDVK